METIISKNIFLKDLKENNRLSKLILQPQSLLTTKLTIFWQFTVCQYRFDLPMKL